MERKNKHTCDIFGCVGKPEIKVVSWVHPITFLPVFRRYCFAHIPVYCNVCKYSIGIIFQSIDKRRKKRKYKCLNCNEVFEIDTV